MMACEIISSYIGFMAEMSDESDEQLSASSETSGVVGGIGQGFGTVVESLDEFEHGTR